MAVGGCDRIGSLDVAQVVLSKLHNASISLWSFFISIATIRR